MDENEVSKLADELITCKLPEDESSNLYSIVHSVQRHNHTKSCLKKHGKCRYAFPKLPSKRTVIAKPLPDDMDKEMKQKITADAKKTLERAIEVLEQTDLDENMELADFVKKLNLDITVDEYMSHISITKRGKTLILKRDFKERFVNNYNIEMMTAWNANMDIQLALDPFAVITYIVNYVNKDESGLTTFMKEALTKVPTNDAKEKLKALKTAYLTHRQIGASEAVYRINPSMLLKDSNIVAIFVNSGFPENRSEFYRKVCDDLVEELEDEELLDSDDEEAKENNENKQGKLSSTNPKIEIDGRVGKYQKAISMIDRYSNRPNFLKFMCLAQFATSYIYQAKPPKTAVFDKDGVSELRSEQKIFNHDIYLPRHIAIKNGFRNMRLRHKPAVLRIHNSKYKNGHEKYYSEMLLFSHWVDEKKELPMDEDACYKEFVKRRDEIVLNRKTIYPGEEIIDLLEGEDLILQRPEHLLETLDGQGNQENADDLEEGIIEDPEFESFSYTGNLDMEGREQFEDFKYKKICLPNDSELDHITRQLVPEQMNVMREVISCCKDIIKSENNPNHKKKTCRLIVHGGAGVGKSQTIKAISMQAEKLLRKVDHHPNKPRVLLAAFTGKASSLIGKLEQKDHREKFEKTTLKLI